MNNNPLRLTAAGALLCAPQTAMSAEGSNASPSAQANSFEEIIVTANPVGNDNTQIAPDAEALLHTAGDGSDPLKALLALPGITFGAGDLDRPVIRGAGPTDNLYLVDGIALPEVYHELSDSIVSANVLRSFDLHSAALPLQYGEAVGGVVDISLRDPLREGTHVGINLSQLKSGAIVETAITPDVAAYASYRINLAHLFLKNFARSNAFLDFRMPQSSDYTGKLVWRGEGFSVNATALGSWDRRREVQRPELNLPTLFGLTTTRKLDAQSLRLAVDVADGGDFTTTISHVRNSDREQQVSGEYQRFRKDSWSVRSSLDIPLGSIRLRAGSNIDKSSASLAYLGRLPVCDYLERRCGFTFSAGRRNLTRTFSSVETFAGLSAAVGQDITLDLGGRWFRDFTLDSADWEPRAAIEWRAAGGIAAYARVSRQHDRPDIERLLLASARIDRQAPQSSWQMLLGARADLGGGWRTQAEGWHKSFDIADLAGFNIASDVSGKAKGVNLLLAKSGGALDAWFAISRSWSYRKLDPGAVAVPYRYNIPWSATAALTWHVTPSLSLGAKWRGQSGVRCTPLLSVTPDPATGNPVQRFGEPWSARAPFYSRLDLRVEKSFRLAGVEMRVYVDGLNILDRNNIAQRTFPLQNSMPVARGDFAGAPDDEGGIPRFVAIGLGMDF